MHYVISRLSFTQVNTGAVQLYTTGVTAHLQFIISQQSFTQVNTGAVKLYTTGVTTHLHYIISPMSYTQVNTGRVAWQGDKAWDTPFYSTRRKEAVFKCTCRVQVTQ